MRTPGDELARVFGCEGFSQLKLRFNIAPTQAVAALRASEEGEREVAWLHWGLVPSWAKDPSMGARLINARSETVAEKPAFRHAFRHKRCLIPADGFYEWRRESEKGPKQPYCIHMEDDRPFAFAGLWAGWEGPDNSFLESCTILTTQPNETLRPIHNRMPVILPEEVYGTWLDPAITDADSLTPLLKPYEASPMEAYPVGKQVNRPTHDAADCIERLELPEQGRLF